MKAFLLSAGLGTRLKPLTDTTPKCLIEVYGRPLLYWWVKLFQRHSIEDVLINVHHLGEQVIEYLAQTSDGICWTVVEEKTLLGSAGTLKRNSDFIEKEKDFFVFYSDVLTTCNLSEVLRFHKLSRHPITMVVHRVENPQEKGVVEFGYTKRITSFEEKPKNPKSEWVNAGIYVMTPEVLNVIPEGHADIGYDLLTKFVGNMKAYLTRAYVQDIGTIENLNKANNEFRGI